MFKNLENNTPAANQPTYNDFDFTPEDFLAELDNAENVEFVDWTAKGLKIEILMLVGDRREPEWSVHQCYGRIDGKLVQVGLPFRFLPKMGMRGEIVRYAQEDGVYAKGIGVLDRIDCLTG